MDGKREPSSGNGSGIIISSWIEVNYQPDSFSDGELRVFHKHMAGTTIGWKAEKMRHGFLDRMRPFGWLSGIPFTRKQEFSEPMCSKSMNEISIAKRRHFLGWRKSNYVALNVTHTHTHERTDTEHFQGERERTIIERRVLYQIPYRRDWRCSTVWGHLCSRRKSGVGS